MFFDRVTLDTGARKADRRGTKAYWETGSKGEKEGRPGLTEGERALSYLLVPDWVRKLES